MLHPGWVPAGSVPLTQGAQHSPAAIMANSQTSVLS